jgi:hypothetical protein
MKEVKFILAPGKFLLDTFNPPISINVLTSEGKKGFFGAAAGGGLGAAVGSLIPGGALIGGAAGILAGGNHTKVTYTVTYLNGWVTTRTVPHKEFVKIYNKIAKQIASYERGQARKARKAAREKVKAQKVSAKIQSEMLKAQRESSNSMLQMTKQTIESNPPQQKHNSTDVASQILALSELYKQGILNESEFEAAKVKVLGNKISSTENANAPLTAFTQQTSSTPVDLQLDYQQVDIETDAPSYNFVLQKFKYLCGWACGSFLCLSGLVFITKAPVAGILFFIASSLCLPPIVKFMEDNLVGLKLSPLQRIGTVVALFVVAVLFFIR